MSTRLQISDLKREDDIFFMNNYQNSLPSPEQRVIDLLSRMSIEEKIGQMMQISYNQVTRDEAEDWVTKRHAGSFLHALGDDAKHLQELSKSTRLGIPIIFGIDAIHGHALHNGATVFPSQLSISCSWNEKLIEEAGRVTAREAAADGLHWTFSPVLCVGRDLRWGRINETFGEDPYLIGVLASAIIKGYQGKSLSDSDSILACAKHYLAYGESIGGRDSYDTEVSLRKIRETFLPPFKMAVDAGCATIMAGYESIDGTPVSASKKLLRDILKDELGFNGFVVTDWNNTGSLVYNQKVAGDMDCAAKKVIEAGNDMIMNTNKFYDSAVKLVKEGIIPEAMIDEAVKRVLFIKFSMGLFDEKRQAETAKMAHVFNCAEHEDVNLRITRESIVLLENKKNALPLGNGVRRIAVIGPNADDIKAQFGDWTFFSHPDPKPDTVPLAPTYTMLAGIKELSEKIGIEVLYHQGCDIMDTKVQDIKGALDVANKADVVIAVIGDCLAQNGEGKDRADLNLSGAQQRLLEELKNSGKPLIVILVNGKPLSVPWVANNADAVLETFNSGALGGKAAAEIIFGEINPSGKLSISFPYHTGQLPVYYNQLPGWHGGKYMDMPEEPVYSFGYGLSYTSFKYSNLTLSQTSCSESDIIHVCVDLTNTGEIDGAETVQIYVNDIVSSVVTPIKQLKGFKKILIKKGETKTVDMPLRISDLYIVTPDEEYVVEPGEFTIMVGSSSMDKDLLKASLTVK
ncbi:MAG: glycoside hydrolase family 3 C-terminal domain-containing protein [Firmicutes bacterium]|nr:glycoside hydrolase family 3 C-terminal domain-containing protein [Bacillota bacterium]